MYCDRQLLPWFERLLDDLPGLELFDAHLHVGLNDPAGFNATIEEVLDALQLIDSKGLLFPLREPSGYDDANAQVIEWAHHSDGRLKALCRLDPNDDAAGKAQKWMDEGAVGLKLHTSAEHFALSDPRLDDVFALAHENKLPVTAHTGTGGAAASRDAVERAAEYPGARIILAHAAMDGQAWLWKELPDVPNLLIDTSWWGPATLLSLMSMVPPGRILYASDIPFASPVEAAILTIRCALQTGYNREQLDSLMGGQMQRLIDRDDPTDAGPPPRLSDPTHPLLERIYTTLLTVVEAMMRGDEPGQNLVLAHAGCDVPEDFPDRELCESIEYLIDAVDSAGERDALRPQRTPGFDLVLIAALLARTPLVPVPAPEGADEADDADDADLEPASG